MSNIISNQKARGSHGEELTLKNELANTFFAALLLSGSDLAKTNWEKELMIWLAEKDQNIYGYGEAGFDLEDIAWTQDEFLAQQDFFLKTIAQAIKKHRWEQLPSSSPYIISLLKKFQALVEELEPEHIEHEMDWDWYVQPESMDLCPKHHVYRHDGGCLICNNFPSP